MLWQVAAVIFAWIVYCVCIGIYRIFFHPLSRFPGPKLAAATFLYEGYHDIVKGGTYPWRIQEMHKKYGPVVRVNPTDIHIYDPDFVEPLLSQRLDRDRWFTESFGTSVSASGTADHVLHRSRRLAVNRFFSKASIASREDVIRTKVLKFCEKLEAYADTGEIVPMDAGIFCLTLDLITTFLYKSDHGYLDVPGFDQKFKEMLEDVFASGAFNRQFPIALAIMQRLPDWLVLRIAPHLTGVVKLQGLIRKEAKRMIAADKTDSHAEEGRDTSHDDYNTSASHQPTVFHQILNSKLPPEEKSEERLVQEAQSIIMGGAEATARVLCVSIVHLQKRPDVLARLRQELQTVMPQPDTKPSLTTLEHLPYLTAVIKESIRLGGSAAVRSSRVSSQPLHYKEWVFPPGTPVSVTLFDVLVDESIFPRPEVFDPMRWVEVKQDGTLAMNIALDKYLVAFSRGPRACLGMWLAWAELYFGMAHIFRRIEMELFETEIEDVAAACEKFSCFAKNGNNGVRTRIVGVQTT